MKKDNKKNWKIQTEQYKDEMKQMVLDLAGSYVADPETIAEFMSFSSGFYNYSSRNTMLIYAQNRHASFVQSFPAWKQMGAHIKKGQKGIKILVPVQKTFLKLDGELVPLSEADPATKLAYKNGNLESIKRTYFKVGNVFDISQTDFSKERYPELISMGVPSNYHAKAFEAVKEFSEHILSCPVYVKDMQSVTLRGYYSPATNDITINHLLEDTQKLSTMAHEVGHAMVHREINAKSPAQVEFEGDCVGIMIESRFGIAPTDVRKKHLADNFHELEKELLESEVPGTEMVPVADQLDKIFGSVYDVYRDYADALDACVEHHVSVRELTEQKENFLERMIQEASNSFGLEDSQLSQDDGFQI